MERQEGEDIPNLLQDCGNIKRLIQHKNQNYEQLFQMLDKSQLNIDTKGGEIARLEDVSRIGGEYLLVKAPPGRVADPAENQSDPDLRKKSGSDLIILLYMYIYISFLTRRTDRTLVNKSYLNRTRKSV